MPDKPARPVSEDGDAVKRAVAYAEETLDVHGAYDRANEAVATLEDNLKVVRKTGQRRRSVEEQMLDREMELSAGERALNPDLSQAAFDRHMKTVLHNDARMGDLRTTLAAHRSEHERAEHEAELSRIRARVECSRLEELNGLLQFYAARTSSGQRD